ncbi:MAG: hypothetical protein ACQKBY_01120 [Verrucomicrobiales bacterium]
MTIRFLWTPFNSFGLIALLALSLLSVSQLPATETPADLLHWSFDEASGNVAADATANGLDLTLYDGTSRVAGQSGNAVRLDGNTGYGQLKAGGAFDGLSYLELIRK